MAAAGGCAEPFIEATVELEDTSDREGPYQVWTVIVGVDRSDAIELHYAINGGNQRNAQMRKTDDAGEDPGELYRGAIPGQDSGAVISYSVAVVRDGAVVEVDPPEGEPAFVFSVTP